MKYWHAPGGTEWGIKIGLVPTGFRPWELGFLCSPTPTGVGERFTLGGAGDSIAHQGAYLSYTYHPPCNRGVKGGGAPMWARKPNSEKLVLSRLEISLCKVCRVDIPVSHIFLRKILLIRV